MFWGQQKKTTNQNSKYKKAFLADSGNEPGTHGKLLVLNTNKVNFAGHTVLF